MSNPSDSGQPNHTPGVESGLLQPRFSPFRSAYGIPRAPRARPWRSPKWSAAQTIWGPRFALAATLLLLSAVPAGADGPAAEPFHENENFERTLDQSVRVVWQGVPLRQAISALSKSQQVAMLIDRRVDPSRRLSISGESRPLRDHLDSIAKDLKLGVAYVGPTVYLGPVEMAERLPTVAALRRQDASRLNPSRRRAWLDEKPFGWNDLATPRGLIEKIAAELQCTSEGLERVPHDLWAAAQLPALAPADQLTLIAAQFDLTYEIDHNGRRLTLVDMPKHVVLERTYPGGTNPLQLAVRWRRLAPGATVRVDGGRVVVAGRFEDHVRLSDRRKPARTETANASRQRRHTLAVSGAPIRRILDQLGEQLGLKIITDKKAIARARLSLETAVSVDVQNATTDELLRAVLEPGGFSFRRDGDRVEVIPADR